MAQNSTHPIDQVANYLDKKFTESPIDEAKHKIVAGLLYNLTLEQLETIEKYSKTKTYLTF